MQVYIPVHYSYIYLSLHYITFMRSNGSQGLDLPKIVFCVFLCFLTLFSCIVLRLLGSRSCSRLRRPCELNTSWGLFSIFPCLLSLLCFVIYRSFALFVLYCFSAFSLHFAFWDKELAAQSVAPRSDHTNHAIKLRPNVCKHINKKMKHKQPREKQKIREQQTAKKRSTFFVRTAMWLKESHTSSMTFVLHDSTLHYINLHYTICNMSGVKRKQRCNLACLGVQ